jgi:citrate lyase beta subunit
VTSSDIAAEAPFQFLLITNSPEASAHAIASGVDLVFVDLEIKGKHARQAGRSTVISGHTLEDVARVRAAIPRGRLLVRINPWDADSPREVENVIALGADYLMLPMFRGPDEIESFVRTVDGRAAAVGLLETAEAAERVDDIAAVDGISRLHIGLNDLHLALKRRFMFELLIDGTVARIAAAMRKRSMPFGIGGLARVGEGLVPAEDLVAEHVALGSSGAILSRTFHRNEGAEGPLAAGPVLRIELEKLRAEVRACRSLSSVDLEKRCIETAEKIRRVLSPP